MSGDWGKGRVRSVASESGDPKGAAGAPRTRARNRWLFPLLGGALVILVAAGATSYVVWSRLDSDGDGLTDRAERAGIEIESGQVFVTDPDTADSDGDGLSDLDELGAVVSAEGAPVIYEGESDPTKADSDDDGIGDRAETLGWVVTDGSTYVTDPWLADTDGDGLIDGVEAGAADHDPRVGMVYTLVADPLKPDSDGDGLDDARELDLSIDPFNPDTDGDRVSDFNEVNEYGTAPDLADTDGDGHSDGYEIAHRDSQGLDPLWPDLGLDLGAEGVALAEGFFFGEAKPGDSPGWLAGAVASGAASAIPGIGWIVGGAADVRDAVALALRGDWAGAFASSAGLVPNVGDAAATSAKVAKFIARYPRVASELGRHVAKLDNISGQIKVRALKFLWAKHWERLTDAGWSDEALLRLQERGQDLSELAKALDRPGHVTGAQARAVVSLAAVPKTLRVTLSAVPQIVVKKAAAFTFKSGVQWVEDQVTVCNGAVRRIDALEGAVAHQVLVGYTTLTPAVERRIASDRCLFEAGEVSSTRWHFFASASNGTVGASEAVLDLLDAHGIEYTVHAPA
ncbi:hypothetical protein [Demequina lignilytica]|uniref:Uncharacterized protein n=1 Tax=Demequina lignilytica TaxID=3051663 RepID=A0AB35MGE3_9MICO|nr:hypothetical protein [Demequina sp. SYSU T0a273]MDN4482862.1 hypothetical protein [Demequina sp. SYSU T0a273]